jgi:Xaa-Pro dipeptidase
MNQRMSRLTALMTAHQIPAMIFNAGHTLTYLTGLEFHLSERPVALIVTAHHQPVIILPELEYGKLSKSSIALDGFAYGENPAHWLDVFTQAASLSQLTKLSVGIEPTRIRFLELDLFQRAVPDAKFINAGLLSDQLRLLKDDVEIDYMQKAVHIAEQALQNILPMIRPGMTERQIAADLSIELLRCGSDSALPFQPIVASGPNSANPHSVPGDRQVQMGDLLLFDWGAYYQGYCSDLTRTYAIGKLDAECRTIYQLVQDANQAGRQSARPGITAGMVDHAARQVIVKGGYGPQFLHRVGHGLGMEPHEAPSMYAENTTILERGMTFTVEPGIYLPGVGGVRIEDNVVITQEGSQSLSTIPRDLQVLTA